MEKKRKNKRPRQVLLVVPSARDLLKTAAVRRWQYCAPDNPKRQAYERLRLIARVEARTEGKGTTWTEKVKGQ